MVETEWIKLPERFKNIHLHEYVVMPNHFHAILKIVEPVGAPLVVVPNRMVIHSTPDNTTILQSNNTGETGRQIGQPQGIAPTVAPTDHQCQPDSKSGKTLDDMVGAFESVTTVNYIRGLRTLHWPPFDGKLWQRNYWDRIIGTHGRVSLLYLSTISKFGTILFLFC